MIVRDAHSGARQIFPQTRRTIENNITALQKFVGPEAGSSKVILKSDAAQELVGAAERLSWLPEPSVANRWPHNAVLERDVRTVKEATRSVHLQAGFDHEMWPLSMSYAATSLSAEQPAAYNPSISQWEAATGEPFRGKPIPLGALVYYRCKDPRPASDPNAMPGIFAGWRIDSGLRYRKVLKVLDFEKVRARVKGYAHPIELPEQEVYAPPELCFPMREAKLIALKNMQQQALLPELPMIELPFDEQPPALPANKHKRHEYITLDRVIRLGATPGCKSCKVWSNRGHTA